MKAEVLMPAWPVQDAKARFSELLDAAVASGPQIVTRRGVQTAVVVRFEEWERLSVRAPRSLKDLLLAPEPRLDIAPHLPPRGLKRRRRAPVDFS